MQMSCSLLPKPAAAPAHSISVPSLMLCRVGAVPEDQTLLTLWIVEQPGPCRQERQPPTRNTHLFLGKQPLGLSVWKGTYMVSLPAGLLEEWCPSSGQAMASAAGNRMEQHRLWRLTL